MKKVILTRGLPGSGKSTWAMAQLERYPDRYKRINRDDLRRMIDGGKHSSEREKHIRDAECLLALHYLNAGYSLIVDDTNLSPSAMSMWEEFTYKHHFPLEIQDFTDVPVEVCIKQDLQRLHSVGESVIRETYNKYILKRDSRVPAYLTREVDPALPICIIYDIDGTVAIYHDRNPYEASASATDLPNMPVISVIRTFDVWGMNLIAVSGRQEKDRDVTEQWLIRHDVPFHALYMRPTGDQRHDFEVKEEIYTRHIVGKYTVHLVLDDRNQTVKLWRELGLPCFQVADGDF